MTDKCIYRNIPRPDKALIESLRGIPVADLHDEMTAIDQRQRLMSPAMRPVSPGKSFVGPAVTSFNSPGDNLMMHASMYFAQSGDVLVVSNGGVPLGALWGGNATQQALHKGLAGVVVDGPIRDTAQIRELGLPVASTIVSVTHPVKGMQGTVNMPVLCAGVLVNPGDIIVGDSDGVIVIPPHEVERIVKAAWARIKRDEAMQAAIAGGSTLFQQLSGEDALKKLGLEIHDGIWTDEARHA